MKPDRLNALARERAAARDAANWNYDRHIESCANCRAGLLCLDRHRLDIQLRAASAALKTP